MSRKMVQSFGLALDARSGDPMYRQIFDQVVARIRSGAFPTGFRLPPSRALADALGTNRNTVVSAYEDLLAAGFVSSTVGRGTFVAGQQPPATKTAAGIVASMPGELPWSALCARAVFAEPLTRVDRLQRSVGPMSTDTINLARMEPSADQIPDELIRRCTDHVLRTLGGKALLYSPRGKERANQEHVRQQGRPRRDAAEVAQPSQASFGFLDVAVARNAWGRQLDSFQAVADDGMTELLFIRAPRIRRVGPEVQVLATLAGEPILVQQRNVTGATFHPELTAAPTLHQRVFS